MYRILNIISDTNIGGAGRVILNYLRHADVATTLRLYATVMPGRDADAAAAFSRAHSGRKEG